MKLLMFGDIEVNPGPEQNVCDQTALSIGSTLLLNYRLRQPGLRPLDADVGCSKIFTNCWYFLYITGKL